MMLRTSCRMTAAMAGVVASMGAVSTEAQESKTSDNCNVKGSGDARLCSLTKNTLAPTSLNLFPVIENGAAALGQCRDNPTVAAVLEMSTAQGTAQAAQRTAQAAQRTAQAAVLEMSTAQAVVLEMSTAQGTEEAAAGGNQVKQDQEDCGKEFELLEVDIVRPNEQGRQQTEADKLKAAITKARDLCWCKMYESGMPGMIVGIAVNGKLVWQHGFGYSDVENKLLAGTGCVMRIASISKPITMAVLAKLVEEGKVDLDETIDKYVKDWPQKFVDGENVSITVRQLCSHMAGIRHYDKKGGNVENKEFEMKEYYIKERLHTTKQAVDLFRNDELMSKPGKKFLYSTHGFTLLAAIIESVTEEPFDKYIKKQFAELGLNNTYLDENQPLIYNRARYYVRDNHHKLQNAPYVDNSYKWAGGGFLSNVSDLLKFGNAMLYSYQYSGQPDNKVGQEIIKKEQSSSINKDKHDIPPKEKEKIEQDTKTGLETTGDSKNTDIVKTIKSVNYEEVESEDIAVSSSVVYHPGPFAAINAVPRAREVVPGYLSKKMMEELWTVQPNAKLTWGGDNLGYGLGWAVVPVNKKYAFCENPYYYVSHTGGAVGASSVLLIAPNKTVAGETRLPQGIVVAVLANLQGVGLNKLAKNIAQVFEGLSVEKPVRVQKVYQC